MRRPVMPIRESSQIAICETSHSQYVAVRVLDSKLAAFAVVLRQDLDLIGHEACAQGAGSLTNSANQGLMPLDPIVTEIQASFVRE
jgi:hypothetical protein